MPDAEGNVKGISVPPYPTVDICPERNAPCDVCMIGGTAHAHCLAARKHADNVMSMVAQMKP